MANEIAERFVENGCTAVIDLKNPTCGSITRASIAYLTPQQLEDLFRPSGLFADMDAWFLTQIEMKACGVKKNAWYDLIYSTVDRSVFRGGLSKEPVAKGPSLLFPFIMGRQESVINQDYWFIHAGSAVAGYTINTPGAAKGALGATSLASGPLTTVTGGTRIIRVDNRYGTPMDPAWFLERHVIHIFNRGANGRTEHGAWKVVSAAVDTSLTYIDVLLASENAGSVEPFDATPARGVIIIGINNVNDYESWCNTPPTIDPRKRVPFWWQTRRTSRCVDSEYKLVYARLMESNRAFKEFGDLDLAERNRQDEMIDQRQFVNAFFFQKPISANQTLALWQNLEAINTPSGAVIQTGMSGKIVGRRANFIGVFEQLRRCDRIFDLQNNAMNLLEFLDLNYDIYRARKSQGRKVTDIDWVTNSVYRGLFQTAAFTYYKDQYLDQLRMTVEVGKLNDDLGMVHDSYYFKRPAGIRINIISDNDFFDDWFTEHDLAGIASAGNMMMALDWGKPPNGSIYLAQLATNRASYTTAGINELARIDATFRCALKHPTIDQTLMSEDNSPIVECPLNSAVLTGIAVAVPNTGAKSTPYSNIY